MRGHSSTEALGKAIDTAMASDPLPLYDLLTRGSNLPSPRINESLVEAFAAECRARGKKADRLAVMMATLDPDRAPGASAHEFLPICGVAAVAARAATDDAAYTKLMPILHGAAEDLRFRVRDQVVVGLEQIGDRRGDVLVRDFATWTDGYFHAAAVLRAITAEKFLVRIASPEDVIARMEESFALARDATRAAFRYPGHKALIEALGHAPRASAVRFGVPVFDMLVRWSAVKEPVLREAIEKNLSGSRLAGRFASELQRVRAALDKSAPVRRDPTTYVGPTRGRSTKARRR